MAEESAFHYARIAAQAEDRLLKLFDEEKTAVVAVAPEDGQEPAAEEGEQLCAG
ncbi:MAG: hypothetical protein Q7T82_00310 [Armatimonadota bacterium]|nr:hypothetical protein [Armatimonadota bacterium]